MQGASGQAGQVTQKFVNGLVLVSGRNLFFKVNFVKADKLSVRTAMKPNGTAIEGVCVTWRSYPASVPIFSLGFVPVARQVWRNICKVGCGCLCDRVTMT